MDTGPQSTVREELEAALGWWREAGVDCDFANEPVDWLAAQPSPAQQAKESSPPSRQTSRQQAASPPHFAIDHAAVPQDLAGFVQWWLSEPGLDGGRTSGRVAPRGERGAELMIVVPQPEREDRDALLSGPQGALLSNMLAAMGHKAGDTYLASALPRHLPGADWDAIGRSAVGEVLRHHVALAAPQRLITFGGNILPLFGNDLPQEPAVLREIILEGQSIPLLAARDLSALLERPRWKADLWKSWLGWTSQKAMG